MKTNKILLSLFTLLTIVFYGCKEEETEFYALNIDNKEMIIDLNKDFEIIQKLLIKYLSKIQKDCRA